MAVLDLVGLPIDLPLGDERALLAVATRHALERAVAELVGRVGSGSRQRGAAGGMTVVADGEQGVDLDAVCDGYT